MKMFALKDCYDENCNNLVVWGFDDETTREQVEEAIQEGKNKAHKWLDGIDQEGFEDCCCDYDFVRKELEKLPGGCELAFDGTIEW